MASIFSQDNPFNDFMSTVGDMAMISIAWSPARGAHPWRTWESFASRLGGLAPLWEAQGVLAGSNGGAR